METFVIFVQNLLRATSPCRPRFVRSVALAYTASGARRQSSSPENGARHFSRPRAPKMSADIRAAKSMACV